MSFIEGLRRFRRRHPGLIEAPLIAAIAATSFIAPPIEHAIGQGTIPSPPGPVEPPSDGNIFRLPLVMNGEPNPGEPITLPKNVYLPAIYGPVENKPVSFGVSTFNADDGNGASAAPIIGELINNHDANVIALQEVTQSETAGYAEEFGLTCVNSRETAICVRSSDGAEVTLTGSIFKTDIANAYEPRDLMCVSAEVKNPVDEQVRDVAFCVGHPHYIDPIPQLQQTRSVIEGVLQQSPGFEDISAAIYLADTNAESSKAAEALNLSSNRVACNEEGGVVCPGQIPDRGRHPGDVDNAAFLVPETLLRSAGASTADSFGGITGGERGQNNGISDHNSVFAVVNIK